jgi:hypothetical protein
MMPKVLRTSLLKQQRKITRHDEVLYSDSIKKQPGLCTRLSVLQARTPDGLSPKSKVSWHTPT